MMHMSKSKTSNSNRVSVPETITKNGKTFQIVKLGPNCFDFAPYSEIHLPKTVREIEWCFYDCKHLVDIFVDAENQHFKHIDGVLFNKDATELVTFPNARLGKYTIPEGTQRISHFAFKTSRIITLHIPASVIEIGDNVFYDCRLHDIYFDGRDNWDDIKIGPMFSFNPRNYSNPRCHFGDKIICLQDWLRSIYPE
jgi:hypothetical protein